MTKMLLLMLTSPMDSRSNTEENHLHYALVHVWSIVRSRHLLKKRKFDFIFSSTWKKNWSFSLPFNVAWRKTLQATICAAACKPVAVICWECNGETIDEQELFGFEELPFVSKHNVVVVVVVVCCLLIGSFEMKAPFRNKITSRGVDFILRRVDDRADAFDEDFNRSQSWLLLELRPNVVVFESIRVASSAMITTLAFGSKNKSSSTNTTTFVFNRFTSCCWIQPSFCHTTGSWSSKQEIMKKISNFEIYSMKIYPRPATRPPRLNFLPFNTRAGTMGIDDWIGKDDVVARIRQWINR